MPLRPVSELGLVDLTDLASRDTTETASLPNHAVSDEKQPQRSPRAKAAGKPKSAGTPDRPGRPKSNPKPPGSSPSQPPAAKRSKRVASTAEASRVQTLVGYRTALATLERSTAHRFATD